MSWMSARGLHHCKVRGVVQQNKKKKEKNPNNATGPHLGRRWSRACAGIGCSQHPGAAGALCPPRTSRGRWPIVTSPIDSP